MPMSRFAPLKTELDGAVRDLVDVLQKLAVRDDAFGNRIRHAIKACINLYLTIDRKSESHPHIDWEDKAMLVVAATARIACEYRSRLNE